MKKLRLILLFILLGNYNIAFANITLNAKTAIVIDYHSGKTLYELEPDMEIFIRDNNAISILKKIQKLDEETFDTLVSSNDPFGFDKREEGSYRRVQPKWKLKPFKDSVVFYHKQWRISGVGHIDKKLITITRG